MLHGPGVDVKRLFTQDVFIEEPLVCGPVAGETVHEEQHHHRHRNDCVKEGRERGRLSAPPIGGEGGGRGVDS